MALNLVLIILYSVCYKKVLEVFCLENVINNLIEIDKKARKIINEAEVKSKEIIDSIGLSKKEFEVKYDDKAESRLKKVREEEAKKLKNSCLEIKDRYEVLYRKLEKAYFENHEKIESEIFNRVINSVD